jgi:sporulation protein YlmC with PRC-barrel domain
MKLSEVLGSEVVTTDGVALGKVRDVWLRQDGPMLGLWGHALRIDALVVSRHGIGFDLGVRHGPVEGPRVLLALARLLPRSRTIPWDQVVSLGPTTVVRADD